MGVTKFLFLLYYEKAKKSVKYTKYVIATKALVVQEYCVTRHLHFFKIREPNYATESNSP